MRGNFIHLFHPVNFCSGHFIHLTFHPVNLSLPNPAPPPSLCFTTVTVKRNVYSEFCSHFLDTCPLELCFGELLAMACPNFLSHQTPETSFTTSQTNTIGEGDMISYYRNLQVLDMTWSTNKGPYQNHVIRFSAVLDPSLPPHPFVTPS